MFTADGEVYFFYKVLAWYYCKCIRLDMHKFHIYSGGTPKSLGKIVGINFGYNREDCLQFPYSEFKCSIEAKYNHIWFTVCFDIHRSPKPKCTLANTMPIKMVMFDNVIVQTVMVKNLLFRCAQIATIHWMKLLLWIHSRIHTQTCKYEV